MNPETVVRKVSLWKLIRKESVVWKRWLISKIYLDDISPIL